MALANPAIRMSTEQRFKEPERLMMSRKKKRSYGSGCVIQRGDALAIRWREPRLMPDGTQKRVLKFESLGAVSRKQAESALRDRLGKAQVVRPAARTFAELASIWKTTVISLRKFSTRKHHTDILDKKLVPRFGSMKVEAITTEHVQRFVSDMAAKYSPNTIRHYHNVLRSFLGCAVAWGYLDKNPAAGIHLPKLELVRPRRVLSPEDAKGLLGILEGRSKTIVLIALLTGVRRGELFALRWNDFDELRGRLRIDESIYDDELGSPKTPKSYRSFHLTAVVVEALRTWRTQVVSDRARLRSETPSGKDDGHPRSSALPDPEEFIFAGRGGRPTRCRQIMRDHVVPACVALGIPRASWITFRRTFATWLDENSVSANQRGALMGNSAEVNANVYTQVTDGPLLLAMERVSSELFTHCSPVTTRVN